MAMEDFAVPYEAPIVARTMATAQPIAPKKLYSYLYLETNRCYVFESFARLAYSVGRTIPHVS